VLPSLLRPAVLALAALSAAGCASPLGGEEIELAAGPVVGPGVGILASGSQRMLEGRRIDLHVEAGLAHQGLDDDVDHRGRRVTKGWDQVFLGLKAVRGTDEGHRWVARAGAVWLRAQGDPVFLDEPTDYGGVFFGVGYEHRLSEHLSTGPDFALIGAFPEAAGGGAGVVPQLAWRLVWHL